MTRILTFLAVFTSITAGLHYYVWARLVRDPMLPTPWPRILGALFILLAVSLPLSFVASRAFPHAQLRPLYWLVFTWMGVGFLLAAFFFAADVGRALAAAALWGVARASGAEAPADPSRRLFLARAIATGVGGGVGLLAASGLRSALGAIRVRELEISLRNLPAALDGMRIVQISDVHIGPLLRKDWLQRVVAQVGALAPDVVAITGDLVDGTVAELEAQVAPLSQLSAPRGVFFVTGNHEYYSGVEDWLAHLPRLGIRPLRNERVEVAPGLDLAGIDDLTASGAGHGPDLARALQGRAADRPVILLAHQPRQFLEAAQRGVDLTLSGHTHGGQIWPFSWLVGLAQPYVAGLHRLGQSQIYVSRGTGFWGPPLRVFAPAEITLFRLRPA